MKRIERMIYRKYDVECGEIYIYGDPMQKGSKKFLSLNLAREERRNIDQSKKHWSSIGTDNSNVPHFVGETSKVLQDKVTGLWYVQLRIADDILVSDLYPHQKIKEIQKYLDKQGWTITALNNLKQKGFQGTTEYNGILPTKEGYCIMGQDHTKYGLCDTLDEAMKLRDEVLAKGVIL